MRMGTGLLPPSRPPDPPRGDPSGTKLALGVLTPIFKGGADPRLAEAGRPFRGSGIRGQLRWWFRATSGVTDCRKLLEQEREIFGGVHGEGPRASRVRVAVLDQASSVMVAPPDLGYALGILGRDVESTTAFHRPESVRATFSISWPKGGSRAHEDAAAVGRALDAWLTLGGIGGRTRRGFGGVLDVKGVRVGPVDGGEGLLARLEALAPKKARRSWPSLGGARVLWGPPCEGAARAHAAALAAMRCVRMHDPERKSAAEMAVKRPWELGADWPVLKGTSPEVREGRADIRLPGFRAALGLPIQFKSGDTGERYTIRPRDRQVNRLPSPVILRVVPLRGGGQFLPCMVVLRPWATVPILGDGPAGRSRGETEDRGVEIFADAVGRLPGWTSRELKGRSRP